MRMTSLLYTVSILIPVNDHREAIMLIDLAYLRGNRRRIFIGLRMEITAKMKIVAARFTRADSAVMTVNRAT